MAGPLKEKSKREGFFSRLFKPIRLFSVYWFTSLSTRLNRKLSSDNKKTIGDLMKSEYSKSSLTYNFYSLIVYRVENKLPLDDIIKGEETPAPSADIPLPPPLPEGGIQKAHVESTAGIGSEKKEKFETPKTKREGLGDKLQSQISGFNPKTLKKTKTVESSAKKEMSMMEKAMQQRRKAIGGGEPLSNEPAVIPDVTKDETKPKQEEAKSRSESPASTGRKSPLEAIKDSPMLRKLSGEKEPTPKKVEQPKRKWSRPPSTEGEPKSFMGELKTKLSKKEQSEVTDLNVKKEVKQTFTAPLEKKPFVESQKSAKPLTHKEELEQVLKSRKKDVPEKEPEKIVVPKTAEVSKKVVKEEVVIKTKPGVIPKAPPQPPKALPPKKVQPKAPVPKKAAAPSKPGPNQAQLMQAELAKKFAMRSGEKIPEPKKTGLPEVKTPPVVEKGKAPAPPEKSKPNIYSQAKNVQTFFLKKGAVETAKKILSKESKGGLLRRISKYFDKKKSVKKDKVSKANKSPPKTPMK